MVKAPGNIKPIEVLTGSSRYIPYITEFSVGDGLITVHDQGILSGVEMRTLTLGALGYSVFSTARTASLSENTIKTQRGHAFKKLCARNMQDAVSKLFEIEEYVVEEPIKNLTISDRQFDVLGLIAQGYSEQEAADRIDPRLTLETINTHLDNLRDRWHVPTGFRSKARLVLTAHAGLLLPRPESQS